MASLRWLADGRADMVPGVGDSDARRSGVGNGAGGECVVPRASVLASGFLLIASRLIVEFGRRNIIYLFSWFQHFNFSLFFFFFFFLAETRPELSQQ
jgi:hypothetical protein